jgi:ribosomal protein S18 acetylase RimI-like enzyme
LPAPERRRQGIGKALLDACVAWSEAHGGRTMWCNARVTAASFYEACGFAREGDAFDLPGIGPHYVMARPLGEGTG